MDISYSLQQHAKMQRWSTAMANKKCIGKKSYLYIFRKVISSIQTFGINGENISERPFYCAGEIKGMMMKERSSTLAQNTSSEPDAKQDQSKKIFERLVDDKIFFFDEDNAYIMN